MKKLIFTLVLSAITSVANISVAATQYRNRYIPSQVCMVDFANYTFNAALLQSVEAAEFSQEVLVEKNFFADNIYRKNIFYALQLRLINGTTYTPRYPSLEEAKNKKEQLLQLIKDTCN